MSNPFQAENDQQDITPQYEEKQIEDTSNDNDNNNAMPQYMNINLDDDSSFQNTNETVRITDTEERKGTFTKFTVYLIESSLFGVSSSNDTSVARRYNDFKWLYTTLSEEFISVFIPSLPPTNVFERFKDEIVSQRRIDLQRFLNRIASSPILSKSTSLELFLCESDDQTFEEQKKIHTKELNERDVLTLITFLNSLFPDVSQKELSPQNTDVYLEDMPRLKEFFVRCDERFTALNKCCAAVFKSFNNICREFDAVNTDLAELYEAEYNERPQFMINECELRYDIRAFMGKYRDWEVAQMNNFYVYFMLNLRYEHEDILSILELFKRYQLRYYRYKRFMAIVQKAKDKDPDSDHSEMDDQLNNLKDLLDIVIRLIVHYQVPQVWDRKMETYNLNLKTYAKKLMDFSYQ